jgi:hypothetical protein
MLIYAHAVSASVRMEKKGLKGGDEPKPEKRSRRRKYEDRWDKRYGRAGIVVEIPTGLHKFLKAHAPLNDQTMRDHICTVLEKCCRDSLDANWRLREK